MLFAKVSPQAHKELRTTLKQTSEAKWYRRLKMIHLSSQQTPVPQLATLFDCCCETVRQDIKRYHADGLKGLLRQSSDGAPAKIPLTKVEWEELLHQSPSPCDRLQTGARNRTQALVVEYLRRYHDVTVTQAAVSLCLKHHKMPWNRGKLKVPSPDPLDTVKRDRIEELKKAADGTLTSHDLPEADRSQPPKPARLVYFDSTDRHWCPDIGNRYVPQGTQLRVNSPGVANPWYALFGSLEDPSGEGLYTIHARTRHQEVRAHLQLLLERDAEAVWIVILDNTSAHTPPTGGVSHAAPGSPGTRVSADLQSPSEPD